MSRTAWRWTQVAVGLAFLLGIVWHLGTGPFLTGVRAVDAGSAVAAIAVTALTTCCSARRWQLVARGLGIGMPFAEAVGAYYRSQFLNTALPGGVLGDVHRGISSGRGAQDVARGLRAVGWERLSGQVVQVVVSVAVLCLFPSPVRAQLPLLIAGAAAVVLVAFVCVRTSVLDRRIWPPVAGLSVVVVTGHVGVFLVAAHAAGVNVSGRVLLPLAALVLLAAAVPLNIGGWGPREGVAAWAFAAAGLGAEHGVAAATAFGVLAALATLPGAVVLLVAAGERPLAGADRG